MTVGDCLEIIGALLLAGAAFLLAGPAAALIVIGVLAIYLGQCFGATPLPRRSK